MERFINILILDSFKEDRHELKSILSGNGNNLLFSSTAEDCLAILSKREIGILLINVDTPSINGFQFLKELEKNKSAVDTYKLVISEKTYNASKLVKGLKQGAIDYLSKPFKTNLVKAKIEVFKKLYFKDLRINQLLKNILPETVLSDLNTYGKFSPKRIEEGTVLFTDFVGFSKIAKNKNPLDLVKELESYFTKFDEIVDRYHLEKIKTIGDSYMALAGVTEGSPKPSVRACLAALEMINYVINQKLLAQAMGNDFMDMRVGLHEGPLVAGIIGTKKTSFDVWGDTVNIASRAEHHANPNSINITEPVANKVNEYFNLEPRGEITIKFGSKIKMFSLTSIRNEFCLFGEGKIANPDLRVTCGLNEMDFEHARREILNRLKSNLPEELIYHDIKHTLNVEKSAARIALLEGVNEIDLILLRTAVLFHDSGYILKQFDNEFIAMKLAENILPQFGYTQEHIKTITSIISATKKEIEPVTLLQKIMCDADHDYLGRPDYHGIAKRLREELKAFGTEMNEVEWLNFQINYLRDTHVYYTNTGTNIRKAGKLARIADLEQRLKNLEQRS